MIKNWWPSSLCKYQSQVTCKISFWYILRIMNTTRLMSLFELLLEYLHDTHPKFACWKSSVLQLDKKVQQGNAFLLQFLFRQMFQKHILII